jgi:hypothetical protein
MIPSDLLADTQAEAPNCPAVYFLLWRGDLMYIGSSADPAFRVKIHILDPGQQFDEVRFLPVPSGNYKDVERHWIRTLRPPHNQLFNPAWTGNRPSWGRPTLARWAQVAALVPPGYAIHPTDPTIAIRPIPGFPGYYASEIGEILTSKVRRGCLPAVNGGPLRLMKPRLAQPEGYRNITLQVGGRSYSRGVARLVLLAFRGPPPSPRHEAAHENGNPGDNRACNLAWKTPAENDADKDRHGTRRLGEQRWNAKLTPAKVRAARYRYYHLGHRMKQIIDWLGVAPGTARPAVLGATWKHVT